MAATTTLPPNRFLRHRRSGARDPRLGRMLLISFAVHAVLLLLFGGTLWPRSDWKRPAVYEVDLVQLPSLRPAPQAPPVTKAPSVKPPPAAKAPSKPVIKPAPVTKPAPAKTAIAVKPQPAPVTPTASTDDAKAAQALKDRLDAIRRRQEREELRQQIAALSAAETAAIAEAPPLSDDAIGASYEDWARAYYKEAWTLSRYQVTDLSLEAVVRLSFDRDGRLSGYELIEPASEAAFNDSVKRAILRNKETILEKRPPRPFTMTVIFNLKDLLK